MTIIFRTPENAPLLRGGEISLFALAAGKRIPGPVERAFMCKQLGTAFACAASGTRPETLATISSLNALEKASRHSQKTPFLIEDHQGQYFAEGTFTDLNARLAPFFLPSSRASALPCLTTLFLRTANRLTYTENIGTVQPGCRAHSGQDRVQIKTDIMKGNERISLYHPQAIGNLSRVIAALRMPVATP